MLLTVFIRAFVFPALELIIGWLQDGTDPPESLEVSQLPFPRRRIHIGLVEDIIAVLFARWKSNDSCFRPWFCTCKAILCRGQPRLMRWILLLYMPLVQDRSLNLLTSSPMCYHYATDAPFAHWKVLQIFGQQSTNYRSLNTDFWDDNNLQLCVLCLSLEEYSINKEELKWQHR